MSDYLDDGESFGGVGGGDGGRRDGGGGCDTIFFHKSIAFLCSCNVRDACKKKHPYFVFLRKVVGKGTAKNKLS